jgi:hypothetical protein
MGERFRGFVNGKRARLSGAILVKVGDLPYRKSAHAVSCQAITERKSLLRMAYPIIPVGVIAVFIVYVLYLMFVKRDRTKLRAVFYPGLAFIVVWIVIWYFLLK